MSHVNTALILANLTAEDDRRFHAARIGYSGATGIGAKPDGIAPYIATYLTHLDEAVKAMGWKKFSVEASTGQWVVRCTQAERFYVISPGESVFDCWIIRARDEEPHWPAAQLSKRIPNAEQEARGLCARLNEEA